MIDRDVLLIYAAASLRSACVGLVGVILAIHLGERGLSVVTTGVVIGIGLAGTAVATLAIGLWGDRLGRKRTLIVLAALTALGPLAVASGASFGVLVVCAFAGMLNGMGRDRGAAVALEQAILPETTDAARRTWVIAWYNVVLDGGLAVGSLAAAIPAILTGSFRLNGADAHRLTFLLCAVAAASTAVPYAALSGRVEGEGAGPSPIGRALSVGSPTKRIVAKLAGLFGLDSLGSGFLSSALIAYWFFRRYGMSEAQISALFFAARVLNATSHVTAAWIARRIGLVNTMVVTHLPSSLFLMAAPLAPSASIASALFLVREGLVEMDVPTRQSYVLAIVQPHERTFASGMTNLTRTVAWAVAPPVAGLVMQNFVLAAPLFIGGTLKIVYDVLLYRSFRHIKAPEERRDPAVRRT